MRKDSEIVEDLRLRLINGHFLPGQRLQPEKLRAQYGCSASTLRESLFRLSTERLVDFQEQRGFRAPASSPQLHHELTLMRVLLESEGARLSIRNGGVEWEARLSAAHHKLSHIESRIQRENTLINLIDLWTTAEVEFHQTLIDASRSKTLMRTHRMIFNQFRQQLFTNSEMLNYIPENVDQHKAILDAALDRDVDRVEQAIYDHLKRNFLMAKAD